MIKPVQFSFTPIKVRGNGAAFTVTVTYPDGSTKTVGTVRDIYIRHMNRRGWDAAAPDGHRAVHDHRWQAALALTWEGYGKSPFPYPASRRHEVEA
jgi:hypothetical protein